MAIASTNLKLQLSGGTSNTDPDLALGGAISSTEITTDTLDNLFDEVTGTEHSAGDVEYRAIYFKNTSGSDSAYSTKIWVSQNTPSTEDEVTIGLDPVGLNGTATTISTENDAPTGVTFGSHNTEETALSLGTVGAGGYYALWVKRTVTAGTTPYSNNTFKLKIKCNIT